jgi:hypothetical protein
LAVLTRPQTGLNDRDAVLAEAMSRPLPPGPTAWPTPPESEEPETASEDGEKATAPDGTATSDEANA